MSAPTTATLLAALRATAAADQAARWARLLGVRAGDIGEPLREGECEPLTAPSVPEPVQVPVPATPEPAKEPAHV